MTATVLKILSVLLLATALAKAGVRTKLSSQFLARGEQGLLEIRVEGSEPDEMPRIPEIKDVTLEPLGLGSPRMLPGRRLEYTFQYIVSSYATGRHVIPAVEVLVRGTRVKTAPVSLEIFDPNELKWGEALSQPAELQEVVKYASIIKVPDKKIYENQTVEAEIKIYVPAEIARSIADWGVPEFERNGLAVWRFEPSDSRGQVNLLGNSYVSLSYPTTLTAIKTGEVEIGPATVRITYVKVIFDRFAQRAEVQATLDIPKFAFKASPLPEGAPAGFDNAVGRFTLGTAIKQTEVTEGEPLAVDVVVSGSGNLDNLRSPKMIDESGWKVYDATANQRGEERRDINGTVVFSQFIRPLEMKSSVPSFRMVFFDPELEKYQTVMTEEILLNMIPATGGRNFESSGPPQVLPLPLERMTDILSLIDSPGLLTKARSNLPGWSGHALAGIIALGLILRALWMKFRHLLVKDKEKEQKRIELRKLSQQRSSDGKLFLKSAGGFVEKWLGDKQDNELMEILAERDRLCFRMTNDDETLSRKRRDEILRRLQKAAFAVLMFISTAAFVPPANAGDANVKAKEAYSMAKYEEAAKLWLEAGPYDQLSADTLYNIGNASYRMGAPGQAALYYRRALARDVGHAEARQNLRFLERKYGSISIDRPSYQYALAKIPLSLWQGGLWAGVWLLVIGLLIFPATGIGSRWRVIGVISFVLGPILISLGGLGWRYFPTDADFAPLSRQAVIVLEKVVLHTDAARTSPEVIDAPPGSIAKVLRRSGRWIYLGFATKTRGWVPVESVEMVIPEGKPKPPKGGKIAADGSSA
ncbi:MAG: BatD family protein [Armatimonadetes bacterium]|nr:BatD family protein [Akkermansiaceae bacterium]